MSDTKHNPLFHRDGTSQQQRRSAEIDPLYAKIDDRRWKDLLSFLWRIAEHIQYYDLRNSPNGHWQGFLGIERAFLLSLIAAQDTAPLHDGYLKCQAGISETQDQDAYLPFFLLLRGHCLQFKDLYDSTNRVLGRELFLSPPNTRLLTTCIRRLLGLYWSYKSPAPVSSDEYTGPLESLCREVGLQYQPLELKDLPADQRDNILRNDFYELHQDLQKLFETVIGHAGTLLDETLKRQGDFQPHIGLIVTFLRLFEQYQSQLNNLTARHLKFYYRDILGLDYRERVADRVFVILQLAKGVDTCRLGKGTPFKAGKDSQGKDLLYQAVQEFIANKAQVADLKSVHRCSDHQAGDGTAQVVGQSNSVFTSFRAAVKADSQDGQGKELDKDNPQFPPFGSEELGQDAELGFALASPILRLAGGERTVAITVDLQKALPEGLSGALNDFSTIHLTCEKGWQEVPSTSGEVQAEFTPAGDGGNPQITIIFTLAHSFPPVVDFRKEIHSGQFAEKWPVCKIVLKQHVEGTENKNYYELFRQRLVTSCQISVTVTGLKDLILQNDYGLLKPEKPTMLFGSVPTPKAAFHIGSAEVFSKKLDKLTVRWEWTEYKDSKALSQWYGGYRSEPPAGASGWTPKDGAFCPGTSVTLSWPRTTSALWYDVYFGIDAEAVTTADRTPPVYRGRQTFVHESYYADTLIPGTTYYWRIDEIAGDGSVGTGHVRSFLAAFPPVMITWERLVDHQWRKLHLNPVFSFPADEYVQSTDGKFEATYTLTALPGTTGKGIIVDPDTDVLAGTFKDLNPFKKYTVDLTGGFIRILLEDNGFLFGHRDYARSLLSATAESPPNPPNPPITPTIQNVELDYTSSVRSPGVAGDAGELRFFHLHPFGVSREPFFQDSTPRTPGLVCNLDAEGYFYLGLAGVKPPQNVSLLFQFVEGTGNATIARPQLHWRYLAEHGWQDFDERGVLSDGTKGFAGTGIISFAIPAEAVNDSKVMPTGYHWIRASVDQGSRAVNWLASVRAQALELEFDDHDNAADHYAQALPAQSITKLLESRAEVKAVTQPLASFGGRPRESRDTYCVRVSERLRHKDRAVTLWDYERLILENFPQIHKVKCLNHTSAERDIAPGQVRLVVIPNLTNLNAVNLLQPAVSVSLLADMEKFLKERCSLFVTLEVVNPRYEALEVTAKVDFRAGCDIGYYNRQLSEDIKDSLTPWKKNAEDIHFYETLHSSVILNFIEERPYVDRLTDFRVDKWVNGAVETSVVLGDIVRSHADSLFVSAPEHAINKS